LPELILRLFAEGDSADKARGWIQHLREFVTS
jgi:hypothetical protein